MVMALMILSPDQVQVVDPMCALSTISANKYTGNSRTQKPPAYPGDFFIADLILEIGQLTQTRGGVSIDNQGEAAVFAEEGSRTGW